jgi:hypothetical protein
MPSSSEDLTFAKIISAGNGRKTVNLKTTMISDQKCRTRRYSCPPTLGLTCVPKKTVPIPDRTLPYLCHIEHANAEADIVEDAVRVFLV